jgi:hypothetical protein
MKHHSLVGVLALASLVGCAFLTSRGAATAAASKTWSCPGDRLTIVSERTQAVEAPPPQISSDPERLAIWKANQPNPTTRRELVVQGCGLTGTFLCREKYDGAYSWHCYPRYPP